MHVNRTTRITRLAVLVAGAVGTANFAVAQTQTATAADKVERIEVTGSNIKRVEGESALPVTVITRTEIERTGAQSATELLSKLPITNGGPFNESAAVGSSVPFSVASLRGLGSTATLVLLDGRRVSNFAYSASSVDLNSIPLAAVERIEILRDGASAIYGSDAIAGVINFILRKDYRGGELTALYADTTQGGAREDRYTLTAGYGDLSKNRFNVFGTFDYREVGKLMSPQRAEFANSAFFPQIGVDGRTPVGSPGSYSFPTAPNDFFPAPGCPRERAVGTFCIFDPQDFIALINPSKKTTAMARATIAINSSTNAYVEFVQGKNEVTNLIGPTPLANATATAYRMPASSPYNPFGREIIVRWRTTDLGSRIAEIDTTGTRSVAALDGAAFGFDYKFGYMQSKSEAESNLVSGYLRVSAVRAGLAAGRINGLGPTPGADFAVLQAAQATGLSRTSTAESKGWDFKATRELFALPGGPAAAAFGYEARKESIADQPAPLVLTGDVVGSPANQPIFGKRDQKGMFIEVNAPLLKSLELGLAIRRDEYSDFGTATKPKVSLRWQPTQSFMFRAGWGEGFRAPGLNQLFQPVVAGFAGERLSDPLRCGKPGQITALDCNNQFRTRSGGNPNLRPEESEQSTLGVLWEPFANLATEFTYWKINKYQDITSLSPVVIVGNIARFGDLIVREPQSATDRANNLPGLIDYISTQQNNIGQTKLDGFDFDIRYSLPTKNVGRFGAQLSSTYLRTYRSQLDGLTFTQMAGKFINTTPLPQWKHNLSLDWSRAAWYARATLNYTGKYEDSGPNALTGQALIISDWTTLDLFVSYAGLMRGLKLSAGVKNAFDLNPPFARGSVFAPGWDVFTHDPRGRVITFSANYRF